MRFIETIKFCRQMELECCIYFRAQTSMMLFAAPYVMRSSSNSDFGSVNCH